MTLNQLEAMKHFMIIGGDIRRQGDFLGGGGFLVFCLLVRLSGWLVSNVLDAVKYF